jgi:hypothetical protein
MPTLKKKGPVWSKATKLTAHCQSPVSICLLEGHCHDAHNPRTWVLVASALISLMGTSSADREAPPPRAVFVIRNVVPMLGDGDLLY